MCLLKMCSPKKFSRHLRYESRLGFSLHPHSIDHLHPSYLPSLLLKIHLFLWDNVLPNFSSLLFVLWKIISLRIQSLSCLLKSWSHFLWIQSRNPLQNHGKLNFYQPFHSKLFLPYHFLLLSIPNGPSFVSNVSLFSENIKSN